MSDPRLTPLLRGFLLHSLYANAPHPLAEKVLYRQAKSFYPLDPKSFARDLSYLERQGHIERRDARLPRMTVTSWAILPTGMQLVEKSSTDPGVDFEELD